MTFDLGLLAYADAVPLGTVEHRYCLECGQRFGPPLQEKVYCGRTCKSRVMMRRHRARHRRKAHALG